MSGRSRNQKGRGYGGQGGQGNPAQQQTQQPAATPQAPQQQLPLRTPPANRPQQQQQAVPSQNLDGAPDTRGRTQSPSQAGSRSGSKARAPSASGRGDKKPPVAKGYDPETRKAYDLLKNVDLGGNAYSLKSGVSIHFSCCLLSTFTCVPGIFATVIVLLHFHVHAFYHSHRHLSSVTCHILDSFYCDAAYETPCYCNACYCEASYYPLPLRSVSPHEESCHLLLSTCIHPVRSQHSLLIPLNVGVSMPLFFPSQPFPTGKSLQHSHTLPSYEHSIPIHHHQ